MTAGPPVALLLVEIKSPIGRIECFCSADALVALNFADCGERPRDWLQHRFGDFTLVRSADQLSLRRTLWDYFDGDFAALDSIPVDTGGTVFQRKVWQGLRRIGAGTSMSYGAFARRLRMARAVRAVGAANGRNPISLVVPCHRLVGHGGDLTGYGGGIARKQWLLRHEGVGGFQPVKGRRQI